ncbi:hypothetical protein D8674_033296 [Pyrus ussuriensis x Pyrus communis]|uniref:Uncharacterized protein n=1 Tax=Pyrus ussuriensis x Pyrus communis TaxID=2448454 RepID=A0A5N5HQJ7_9ROSA|nr:hypothetical protein D8674_033296 [Pyrus ussuriensis x Pyrus communis]
MDSENNTTLDLNKPSKFKGLHFKCWRQKMLTYYFSPQKKIGFLCTTVNPTFPEKPTIAQTKLSQTWIGNDFLAKNYILNGLSDDLYDYYSDYGIAKDLWEALQKKYENEEMVDYKSVEAQSHELQKIAREIISKGMVLDYQF